MLALLLGAVLPLLQSLDQPVGREAALAPATAALGLALLRLPPGLAAGPRSVRGLVRADAIGQSRNGRSGVPRESACAARPA